MATHHKGAGSADGGACLLACLEGTAALAILRGVTRTAGIGRAVVEELAGLGAR